MLVIEETRQALSAAVSRENQGQGIPCLQFFQGEAEGL
jgi:hypothetical protein